MPPGARRGGGGKEAGRAEGGRREERRTREEGLRGRGEGKRAAWEGKGRRSGRARGRGRGPGPRESAERERKGRRERRIRGVEEDPGVHSFSRSPLPCLPASPSLSVRAWSPRRCVTTPRLARAGKQLQNFQQTSPRGGTWAAPPDWAGRRRAADLGGQTPAPGTPSVPPLSAQVSSRQASATSAPRRTPPPV